MNETLRNRLRDFARSTLERRGALVEWPEGMDEGWAMLPPELAPRLGGTELLRLTNRAEAGGLGVNLATDFLDRIGPLVEAEPRAAAFQIPEMYLKRAAMDEPVARAFTWLNARVRVKDTSPERAVYDSWSFLAALRSDDRWEDLVTVTLNSATGAESPLPDLLALCEGRPALAALAGPDTFELAARRVAAHVERRAAAFIERLENRLRRDRKRLREYYGALLREQDDARHKAAEEDGELGAKRRAVELELRRKTLELDERYRLRVELTPLTLVRLEMPVLAVECEVLRRQASRSLVLHWNPVLSALEPTRCSRCGAGTFAVAFEDESVAPRCPACARNPPSSGRQPAS